MNNNNHQLLDKLKQQQQQQTNSSDDILSSLVFNAQNDAKRIYKAKNEILPVYKFKRWFKPSKKQLQSVTNSVIHTNGSDKLNEDVTFSKMTPHFYSVPWLGVDKKNLEFSETVMIDIDSDSTTLPVFCKILIVHQGAVHVRSPALLLRDVSIQVGNDILFNTTNNNNNNDNNQSINKKRSSWALSDEYYSTPFYQHAGKSTGSKYNQDSQVTEQEFLSYSAQQTSTEDLISHLRLHIHSKTDIMSEFSLSTVGINTKLSNISNNNNDDKISSYSIKSEKRFRRLPIANNENSNNVNFKLNQNNIKRYENVCSLTGIRRLTLIMPPTSSFVDFDDNIVREIDYLKPLLKFEEYNVIEMSVDTNDLNNYIQSDNYTYVQLLSENALIGKGVQKSNISNNSSLIVDKKTNYNTKINSENVTTVKQKPAISSSSCSSILKSAPVTNQIKSTKSNNIATQTDLFKRIKETKEKHQQQNINPVINSDNHNYDITDILERYNLKKVANSSSFNINNNIETTPLLAPSLTPLIPHTKLPSSTSSASSSSPNNNDFSIDLTQVNNSIDQHLSSSRSFNQISNRSHRSNSSSHNNNNNNTSNTKDLNINDTNDYYSYYYYNANNSRYPLISKAVSNHNHNHHYQNYQHDEHNLVINEKLRSKSSKPVLMRGRSFRIIAPDRNDLHATNKTVSAVLDQPPKHSRHSRKHNEYQEKIITKSINEENTNNNNNNNKYCFNCNRKQSTLPPQPPTTTSTTSLTTGTREKELILKLDKTKVNDIDFVDHNSKIDKIVFIPAVLASRSEHINYNHNHKENFINGANKSRYRRSKYDRSLYMYTSEQQPKNIKGYYVPQSSSTDSDDTAIIDLTRRFKIAHNNMADHYQDVDDDYDDENDNNNDHFIDQLII